MNSKRQQSMDTQPCRLRYYTGTNLICVVKFRWMLLMHNVLLNYRCLARAFKTLSHFLYKETWQRKLLPNVHIHLELCTKHFELALRIVQVWLVSCKPDPINNSRHNRGCKTETNTISWVVNFRRIFFKNMISQFARPHVRFLKLCRIFNTKLRHFSCQRKLPSKV